MEIQGRQAETLRILEEELSKYPRIFFYPTDQSVFKELECEIQLIELKQRRQEVEERYQLARLKEVEVFQNMPIDVWAALNYLRDMMLDITVPIRQITSSIYIEFVKDIGRMCEELSQKSHSEFQTETAFEESKSIFLLMAQQQFQYF